MAPLLIGYARVSTDEQDLTAQREWLAALGVNAERIYVDHGLTGTNRAVPGRPKPADSRDHRRPRRDCRHRRAVRIADSDRLPRGARRL
jgi:DNA invertase Pin-like site-specific DNA recombinase